MESKNRFKIETLKESETVKLSGTIRTESPIEGSKLLQEALNESEKWNETNIDISKIDFCNSSFFMAMAIFIGQLKTETIKLIANDKSIWQQNTIKMFKRKFDNINITWVS
jgi:hypothetical protein